MPHSEYEALIDAYLLDRLSAEETERFERHYFDCPECFRKTAEQAGLIEAVKAAGPAPAAEKREKRAAGARRFPLAWAAGGAAVILLAAAALLFLPRSSRPPDFPDGGIRSVRGETLTLIGPVGPIREAPREFAWAACEGATDYSIILEGIDPAWTAETRDTSIAVPAEIAARMAQGKTYFWRVKAFSAAGALLASSARTSFTIAR